MRKQNNNIQTSKDIGERKSHYCGEKAKKDNEAAKRILKEISIMEHKKVERKVSESSRKCDLGRCF